MALLVGYGLLVSLTFTLAKAALAAGVRPLGYAAWQTGGAGLLMAGVALARGVAIPRSPAALAFYAVCGFIGIAMPSIAMFTALEHIPAGTMAVIAAATPLCTFALTASLGAEPATRRRLFGLLLGLAGALAILGPRAALPGAGAFGWALLGFLAPLGYAAGSVYTGLKRPAGASPVALTVGMLICAGGALATLALIRGEAFRPAAFGAAEAAIAAQIVVSGLGYLLFFEIIRIAGAVFFSQTSYVVALAGMAWPWLLFGESVQADMALAAALILAGIAFTRPFDRARAQAQARAASGSGASGAAAKAAARRSSDAAP